MFNTGLFLSQSIEWATPQGVFDELNGEFGFTVDVCASPMNAKCQHYYSQSNLTLMLPWEGIVFMNPPYGSVIGKWIQKAYNETLRGTTTVCLLPSRTDTFWFHEYCMKGEIRFIKGRLKFNNSRSSAPFPSMVVIFRPSQEEVA